MDNLIRYFFKDSEKSYHVRELAKLSGKSPSTVSKYLNDYKKQEILKSERKLNHLLFKANLDNSEFKDLKFSYNVGRLRDSGLIDFLIDEFNHPEAIVLFGSFRKAENLPESDVDLLVITPSIKKLNLSKFEKKLGNKIQLFQHSQKSIRLMKKNNKELLNNFVNGFIIYGHWELFK
tara:strand:- start:985 stop:1515 length:531 start_codon:yes stop_codon:yes gene_type:complete